MRGRGVLRTASVAGAVLLAVALAAVSAAGSRAAKRKPAPVVKLREPTPGHVTATALLFTRKAGSKPPKVTLAARYPARTREILVGGVGRWANSTTQWVALVAAVNFKPQPPPEGRALAASSPTTFRIRAQAPYKRLFLGSVPLDTRIARPVVIKTFAFDIAFKRVGKGIPTPYGDPENLLKEVWRALAGIPSEDFANAVAGRPRTGG